MYYCIQYSQISKLELIRQVKDTQGQSEITYIDTSTLYDFTSGHDCHPRRVGIMIYKQERTDMINLRENCLIARCITQTYKTTRMEYPNALTI